MFQRPAGAVVVGGAARANVVGTVVAVVAAVVAVEVDVAGATVVLA
jgi:hypothetical protein